jgi:uncharacterized membrane protein (DUF4010 family)
MQAIPGATGIALLGALFFFIIIGVFGLPSAICGLLIFVLGAIAIYRLFPAGGDP